MFIAPCSIRKNIASRKWRQSIATSERQKDSPRVTGYKHLVRRGQQSSLHSGQIHPKGELPRIAVLNINRHAPDIRSSDLLTAASAVGGALAGEHLDGWRKSRGEAIGDADAFDLATGPGPVLHCIAPGCEVGAEYIHK